RETRAAPWGGRLSLMTSVQDGGSFYGTKIGRSFQPCVTIGHLSTSPVALRSDGFAIRLLRARGNKPGRMRTDWKSVLPRTRERLRSPGAARAHLNAPRP